METTHRSNAHGTVRTSSRAMLRGNLPLTVFLAFGIVSPATSKAEDEPNDTQDTATTTGLSGLGSVTVTGVALGNGDWPDRDVDIYYFEIDKSTPLPVLLTVEVESLSSELDTFVRLFVRDTSTQSPEGLEVANNDDRSLADVNPRVSTYLLEGGVYYVGVSTSSNPHYDISIGGSGRPGTGGAYTLTITTEAATLPDSPFEPNDRIATATRMGSESFVVTGEFIGDGEHGRRDVDNYQLALDGAAMIDVEVRAEAMGSTLDPVVRLRNCDEAIPERTYIDGCLLGSADDEQDGSVDACVSVGALTPQTVYIMVSGAGNRRYNPAGGQGEMGSVGPYELVVTVTYFDRLGPNEPNDSIETATPAALFVSGRPETVEVDGFLGDGRFAPFQGDRDFYSVTLVDNSRVLTVSVDAAAGSNLDPVVAAFDVEGRLLAVNDNHGGSVNARIVLPVGCVRLIEETISVYVMVVGTAQRFPADPFLPRAGETVVEPRQAGDGPGSTGDYKLTLSVESEGSGCAAEPNDTLATATSTLLVDEGAYVCTTGEIGDGACDDPSQDLDLWSFELTSAPARLEVTVFTCRGYWLYYYSIYLFDSTGTLLALQNGPEPLTEDPIPLRAALDEPGTYFVGVSGEAYEHPDPTVPCSVQAYDYGRGRYDLAISLAQGRSGSGGGGSGAAVAGGTMAPSPLFATRLDDESNMIDALDPDSGAITRSFAAPEPRFGGSEGLACGGISLYYMGVGRFPKLYRLDPATGEVLDDFILWSGSGYYGDVTILGGEVYVLDLVDRSIHVVDPATRRLRRTLPVGTTNDITVGGGLAALSHPDRLYVADGFNTRAIYEVNPQSGVVTHVVSPPRSDCCIPEGNGTPGCDNAECAELVCFEFPWCCAGEPGSNWEPYCAAEAMDRCDVCTQTFDLTTRPTALGGIGPLRLYVADWQTQTAELIERSGKSIGPLSMPHSIGSLGGNATVGPFGLSDLIDWIDCLTGPDRGPYTDGCRALDFDRDLDVDMDDLAWFQIVFGGDLF